MESPSEAELELEPADWLPAEAESREPGDDAATCPDPADADLAFVKRAA